MDAAPVIMDGTEVEDEVEKTDMVVDLLARGVLARDPVNEAVYVPKVVFDRVDVVLRPFLKVGLASLLERLLKGNPEIRVLGEVFVQLFDNGSRRRE